jgi:hypothetical protein
MKYLFLAVSMICSMIAVEARAYQTEMPTVCQTQGYCHECCKGVAPQFAQPDEQYYAPVTTKQVNPTVQGK